MFSAGDAYQRFMGRMEPLGQDARERLRLRLRSRLAGDGADRPFVRSARAWAVRGRLGARK